MNLIQKLAPVALSLVTLGLVIYYLDPPKSWLEASIIHWLSFYLPLLLLLTSLLNFYLQFWLKSLILGFGLTILIILFGLSSLNLASGLLTIIAITLIIRSLKKPDRFKQTLRSLPPRKLQRQ
jgi:hypothetical protein